MSLLEYQTNLRRLTDHYKPLIDAATNKIAAAQRALEHWDNNKHLQSIAMSRNTYARLIAANTKELNRLQVDFAGKKTQLERKYYEATGALQQARGEPLHMQLSPRRRAGIEPEPAGGATDSSTASTVPLDRAGGTVASARLVGDDAAGGAAAGARSDSDDAYSPIPGTFPPPRRTVHIRRPWADPRNFVGSRDIGTATANAIITSKREADEKAWNAKHQAGVDHLKRMGRSHHRSMTYD